jgi:hypothetical protein
MPELSRRQRKIFISERAGRYCEYCYSHEYNIGQPMEEEHIDPNGTDDLENLCLSCGSCNVQKGITTSAPDPLTGEVVPLFNPRTQNWDDHFYWSENATVILGKTAVGRATIERLKMNQRRQILARAVWHKAGAHPPKPH